MVGPRNAKTIQLGRSHIRQKHMPDLIGVFSHWNANIFLVRVEIIEEAKINRSSRFRKKRKVHAVAQPRRAKWIRKTKPSLYRSHKRAPRSYRIWNRLAITKVAAVHPNRFFVSQTDAIR